MKKEAKLFLGIISGYTVLGGIYTAMGYTPVNTDQDDQVVDVFEADEPSEEDALVEVDDQEEAHEDIVDEELTTPNVHVEQIDTSQDPEVYSTAETDNQPVYAPQPTVEVEQASNNIVEDPNLPLKAICKDGTIQYQDDPTGPNYRGMCSSHGGIVEKLGRIP